MRNARQCINIMNYERGTRLLILIVKLYSNVVVISYVLCITHRIRISFEFLFCFFSFFSFGSVSLRSARLKHSPQQNNNNKKKTNRTINAYTTQYQYVVPVYMYHAIRFVWSRYCGCRVATNSIQTIHIKRYAHFDPRIWTFNFFFRRWRRRRRWKITHNKFQFFFCFVFADVKFDSISKWDLQKYIWNFCRFRGDSPHEYWNLFHLIYWFDWCSRIIRN